MLGHPVTHMISESDRAVLSKIDANQDLNKRMNKMFTEIETGNLLVNSISKHKITIRFSFLNCC